MRRGLIVMITWWDEAWASLNEGWGRVKSMGPMNSSMIVFRIFDLYNRIGVMFKINEACVIGKPIAQWTRCIAIASALH